MSTVYYTKLWLQAREDLEKIIRSDLKAQKAEPLEDLEKAANLCLDLYYRYRSVIRRITECHDQLVQPQVREIIGKILDYTIVRMLEIRSEIVRLTLSECSWPIELLLKLKLTPDDVTPRAPAYDLGTRMSEMERRQKIVLDFVIQQQQEQEAEASIAMSQVSFLSAFTVGNMSSQVTSSTNRQTVVEEEEEAPEDETEEEKQLRLALLAEKKKWDETMILIQKHERARIGRCLGLVAEKKSILMRMMIEGTYRPATNINEVDRNKAASVIQRAWRRFMDRRRAKERWSRMDEAYEMTRPSYSDARKLEDKAKEAVRETLERQREADEECKKTIEKQKNKLYTRKAPEMVDNIKQELRDWMFDWLQQLGFIDWIPGEEFGGSKLIVTGQSRTPEEYRNLRNVKAKPAKAPTESESAEADDDDKWKMPESMIFGDLVNANQKYLDEWTFRTDKTLDPENPLIVEAMTDEICYHLQLEMRVIADAEMRPELDHLNEALAVDLASQRFKPPEPENFDDLLDTKKDTKDKKKKGQSRNSLQDPFADVSEDDLLIELALSNVMREIPEEELDDWPGAPAYNFGPYYQMRLGDVKHPVIDYCILPLGSKIVNSLVPLIRSVCICGPPRSGPVFLARAVCNELKATVFDLTPERHVGRFTKKSDQDRLAKVVVKLARSYAPSVILVENEAAWLKTIPPSLRKAKPAKFLPVYAKIVKEIKRGDRVLFLTASCEPYLAGGSFLKTFDRFLVVPEADYGTLVRAYKTSLTAQHNVDRYFDVSCLAKLMSGAIPLEEARDILDDSLVTTRRIQFRKNPLRQAEIFDRFLERSSMLEKNSKKWDKFRYGKVQLERKRKKVEDEKREAEAALAAKLKKKK